MPYYRFTAEIIAAWIEAYATAETVKYRDLSTDVSDLELVDPEMDVRAEEMYKEIAEEPLNRREKS